MGSKILVGAVLGFILISVAVYVLYQQQEAQPQEQDYETEFSDLPPPEDDYVAPQPGSILQECGQQETQHSRDMCWLYEAADELDASKCLNIESRPTRISCIRGLAVGYESDATYEKEMACGERYADDLGQFFDCIDALIPTLRQEKLSICDQFLADDQTQMYLCKTDVAKELVDYSICETMPTNFKESCMHVVSTEDVGMSI